MLRLPFIVSTFLSFAALASAKERDLSFLSPEAQAVTTQLKALHEQIHDKIEQTSGEWMDLGKDLHDACRLGGGMHRPGGQGSLNDEQKKELEAKLTSEACTKAIAAAQTKLK